MTDKKGFILNHQDFEPFGPEWEKEMMKLPKKAIIDLYRRACQEVPVSLPSANEDQEVTKQKLCKELWEEYRDHYNLKSPLSAGEELAISWIVERFTLHRK